LGSQLAQLAGYAQAFPALIAQVMPSPTASRVMVSGILNMGIAASSLGAAYGIMYSNAWNLFGLAQLNAVPCSSLFSKLNTACVPFAVIILEGLLAAGYLLFSRGNQVPLQQICSLGMTITYSLSAIALVVLETRRRRPHVIIPLLAVGSCGLLALGFINNLRVYSAWPAALFAVLVLAGALGFIARRSQN
jgi:hypothetical protein